MRSVRFRLSDREGKAWESLEEEIKGQRSPGRFQKRPGPLSQACAALPTPVLAPSLSQLGFLPPPHPNICLPVRFRSPGLAVLYRMGHTPSRHRAFAHAAPVF